MRRSKIVEIKIDDKTSKSFTVKEMSVEDIIELSQNNELLGGKKSTPNNSKSDKEVSENLLERGFMEQLKDTSKSVSEVMKKTCDFQMEDLKKLAPSEVEEIFDEWKEVNTTFLSFLEKVGVLEAGKLIMQKAMSDFLRMLAT